MVSVAVWPPKSTPKVLPHEILAMLAGFLGQEREIENGIWLAVVPHQEMGRLVASAFGPGRD